MPDAFFLLAAVGLPYLGALVVALLPNNNNRNIEAWLAGGVALLTLVMVWLLYYPDASTGGVLRLELPWVPELGLNFVLRMDGLASVFAVMVAGIGFLVVLYARYYMSPEDPIPRFFAFLLAFMGSMMGLVLSGNLVQLVFFWELTSLFSFLLIGYWQHAAPARDGARMALTVTSAGGLALFAGVLVLGHIVGSYDLDRVLASGDVIRTHPLYLPALVLILLGALTKSAQFPFHFWLPHAMAAPTPVSAYLHSATLVKAGIFLMIRLWPVLSGTEAWFWIVSSAGVITLLLGAYVAIFQHDLKGLLAYSTISHLGLITLLLGLNSQLALVAAIFHTMNHATFKASLFMAAGIIDHETGTRDIRRLSGLNRSMPFTARLALVAAAAMAGVPLLNGFISKEMFFTEALTASTAPTLLHSLLPVAATVAGIFAVAYSLRFIHGAFFGPDTDDLPRTPHEPPQWMRLPVEVLVFGCMIVGILPAATIGPFLDVAVRSVLGNATPEYSLAVWHGINLPLAMSIFALVMGVLLYRMLQRHFGTGVEGTPLIRGLDGRRIFDRAMVFLSWRFARTLERLLGTSRLQMQLRLLVCVSILAATLALLPDGLKLGGVTLTQADPVVGLIWLVGAGCAIGAAYQAKYHRLAALVLMGGTGLAICLTFVWFSAPDLALTQLLVEVVTTVLLLLGLRWLPKRVEFAASDMVLPRLRRYRDFVIAVAAGAGLTAVSYATMTRPSPEGISRHFLERAYTEGGGTNVVNVILVDFRGFDTLGEITVLGIVALTVFALLRRFRPAPESVGVPEQQQGGTGDWLLVPGVIMRLMFPVICVVALFLLLRGHDLPGGGFAAGLMMSVAILLQYMAGGTRWVEDRLRVHPLRWMGVGLLLAAGTGSAALLFGRPFLTSYFAYADLGWLGKLPLASAVLFDLGVFSLVFGATVLMLIAIAHQSVRSPKPAPSVPPSPAPVGGDD
ncbi:monovalent cation/H+ antiporter subunit A [Pseudoroseomonas wenyumeiae]|uniref:Monovalent cation/H+ antiporter subunit A n=1 Tax=Teichococcus wenyumeiae TaxID=2478470 RepID=A0A3A9JJ13_9PROT|nr:monovalent cation/H+ antiporter subunit A [Pseudoroseomonas wenyumeiae]RKK03716.1 monovalent cation/H+ antiporter subunit A [Pseudoroseomonas wenyumeiae]RMI20490.1 monovalent cation/H+ antiporter subunit A [Pseudoroseomonas wenyumeiae]